MAYTIAQVQNSSLKVLLTETRRLAFAGQGDSLAQRPRLLGRPTIAHWPKVR